MRREIQDSALFPKKGETGWSTSGRRWSAVAAMVGLGVLFTVVRGGHQSSVTAKVAQPVAAVYADDSILSPTIALHPVGSAAIATPTRPVSTATGPSATPTPRNGVVTHVVMSGETLSHLSVKYDVSVDSIRWANGLTDDLLQIDQKLLIPPVDGVLYTVREGESVRDIAANHAVEPQKIVAANKIDNPDVLPSGMTVVIPGATPTEEPTRAVAIVAVRGGDRSSDTPPASASPSSPSSPGPASSSGSNIASYEVKPGDTLTDVAAKFGVTISTVVNANSIPDPDHLSPGQQLIVPSTAGILHTVQEGDSVTWIAARYGVTLEQIISANKLSSPDLIKPGSRILIPSPSAAPAAVAVAAAPQRSAPPATYTVKPGDTLLAIAFQLGTDVSALAQANGLSEPFFLRDGQTLQVPGSGGSRGGAVVAAATPQSAKHVVVSGDTVFGLAVAAKVTPDSIISANGLEPPYILQIGRELVMPGASSDVQLDTSASASTGAAASNPAPAPAPVAAAPAPAPASSAPKPAPPPPTPTAEPPSFGSRVVDIAMKYRGYRYTWGGISPSTGFDCSGLVYYVYQQAGRPIPRSLSGQLSAGQRVNRSDLQPGDIVFFVNTYTSGLSHDGIYIGGGRFINANNENVGIIVNSLSESYWGSRYYGASRP